MEALPSINIKVWRFPAVWSVPLEWWWRWNGSEIIQFEHTLHISGQNVGGPCYVLTGPASTSPPQCSRQNSHHHSPGNFYWGENIFPESIYLLTSAHIYCFASRLFNPRRSEEGWAGLGAAVRWQRNFVVVFTIFREDAKHLLHLESAYSI